MGRGAKVIRSVSFVDIALAIMVAASIGVVALPKDWLQTSLEIVPSQYRANLLGDAYVGGNSKARWVDERAQRWQCNLQPGAQDPYCSLQLFPTNADGAGLDLSRFDKMTIWAEYSGDATHLRLYLRNRHPNYFKPDIEMSTKYNQIEIPVRALSNGLELRMSDFTVAGWWLIGGNVPLSDSQPEFNDVAIFELQTGSTVRSGTHEIQLKKIRWSGPLVKQSTLYQVVIIIWSAAMICFLLFRLVTAQRELKTQRTTQEELMSINASLSLETKRFEQLAKTDLLTGLRNRVGIRDILYRGLVDWRDKQTPFSFIIIDLDNFKKINDTYGHDVGDTVLKNAAKLMLEHVRGTDTLSRWGGEEFVLTCPDTTLAQAAQAAENLRAALEGQLRCQGKPVTASFGVATMTEAKLEKLFKKADLALYRAKLLGRNCVCIEDAADEDSKPVEHSNLVSFRK